MRVHSAVLGNAKLISETDMGPDSGIGRKEQSFLAQHLNDSRI